MVTSSEALKLTKKPFMRKQSNNLILKNSEIWKFVDILVMNLQKP